MESHDTSSQAVGAKAKSRVSVLLTYCGILLVAGYFLLASFDYELYRGGAEGRIGPGYLPRFASGLLVLLTVCLIFQEMRKGSKLSGDSGVDDNDGSRLSARHLIKITGILVSIAVAIIITPFTGLVPAFGMLVAFLAIVVERMKVIPSLLIAIAITVFGHLVFIILLRVPAPTGIFGGVF